MNILFLGDIVGKSGRAAVIKHTRRLRQEWQLDVVVVNGENAAHGFGLNKNIVKELQDAGVDVITNGNHAWDQKEFIKDIALFPSSIRPANYPAAMPGKGHYLHKLADGRSLLVVNIMGQLFMHPSLDCPFAAVDAILKDHPLGRTATAILVDIHAEASSEKQVMGAFCDGRVSCVVGTHTHVPTADVRILPNGSAYQTDAGMCGDYNSILGMDKSIAVPKLVRKVYPERLQPAKGEGTLCGLLLTTDDKTGLAKSAKPVQVGSKL